MSPRPRALVIAEAANPEWVSVPLVGWSHFLALREVADVQLVTQVRNKEAIERTGLVEDVDFYAIDSEAIASLGWKLSTAIRGGENLGYTTQTALELPSYLWFELLLWQRLGARIQAKEWDLVHRLTPLSPTTPSFITSLLRRAGVPFVLGPLNGGVPWPKEYDAVRREEKEWLSYVRGAHRFLPGFSATRENAAAILAGSRDVYQQLGPELHDKTIYLPENGIDLSRFGSRAGTAPGAPLKVCFAGRLVPYKGAAIVLEAAADLIRNQRLELDIIGDGPEMPLLANMVSELGLGRGVTLPGWIDHTQIHARMSESQVFAFPSIREFGGGAVLEAMTLGLVPIVVDYAGPAELVTKTTGFVLPLGPRESLVASLRAQLSELSDHPERIPRLGENARARALRWFAWPRKAEQTRAVYDWVLGQGPRPDFGMPFPDADV